MPCILRHHILVPLFNAQHILPLQSLHTTCISCFFLFQPHQLHCPPRHSQEPLKIYLISSTSASMAQMIHDMLNPWSASKIPSLTGRVAVVTGGNEGIAAAFIAELFKHDVAKVCHAVFPSDPYLHHFQLRLTLFFSHSRSSSSATTKNVIQMR